MTNKNTFTETDIYRTSTMLLRNVYNKVKNIEIDCKRTIGYSLLNNIKNCIEYAKMSYLENKNLNEMKLKLMVLAKREIQKAEIDLNLIVSLNLFPGKLDKFGDREVYINGGSEISKNIGELLIQINSFITSLESKLTKEQVEKVYNNI